MASTAYQNLVNYCVQLRKLGMEDAVISPGSRNAPVIKALEVAGFQLFSCVDERSAAFIAMGMAKQSGRCVVLSCTSGSAGLNYYPAIAEAYYSQIPLLVLTADRPEHQIDQWEGQSIRQTNVYSNHIRFQSTLHLYSNSVFSDDLKLASGNWGAQIPGPIHINIPLHEPLYEFNLAQPRVPIESNFVEQVFSVTKSQLEFHLSSNWKNKKVLFFQGMETGEGISLLAEGSPLLCDVTAGKKGNILQWDALLFTNLKKIETLEQLAPDILISSGNTTVSKGLRVFLKRFKPKEHYHVGRYDELGDMFETKPTFISIHKLTEHSVKQSPTINSYLQTWREVERDFSKRMNELNWDWWNQFSVTGILLKWIPKNVTVHFANSMPIRYASLFATRSVLCNRGTSGIDGCTSTAIGYALKSESPNILITGDVAFLYDINALWFSNLPNNFKIVVLNNQGGGIFEMIEGPKKMGSALKFQTTPHQRNIKSLAAHFGIHYLRPVNMLELEVLLMSWLELDQPSILEIPTNSIDDQQFFNKFKALAE